MITALGVIVPARDEAELLPGCISSILAAIEHADMGRISCRLAVVLDSCRDGSAAIAHATRRRHPFVSVIEIGSGNVGDARRRGVEEVLAHLPGHRDHQTWIASTDADSRVPPTWLRDQVALADAGSDVVAGVISIDDWHDRPATTRKRFAEHYRIGPDGSHDHVHGANIGFRASHYRAAGGVPPLSLSEDHALLEALSAAGATVTRTAAVSVVTSARRRARAEGGFSEVLDRLT